MDTIFWVLVVAFAVFQIAVMVVVLRAGLAALEFFEAEAQRRYQAEQQDLHQRFGAR